MNHLSRSWHHFWRRFGHFLNFTRRLIIQNLGEFSTWFCLDGALSKCCNAWESVSQSQCGFKLSVWNSVLVKPIVTKTLFKFNEKSNLLLIPINNILENDDSFRWCFKIYTSLLRILQQKWMSIPIVMQVTAIAKYTITFNCLQMQSAGWSPFCNFPS